MFEHAVKTFDWRELEGKTLKILAGEDVMHFDGYKRTTVTIVGEDVDTHEMYVLHENTIMHVGSDDHTS